MTFTNILKKRDFTLTKFEEYTQIVRNRLSDYRFYHSLCVSDSARELARRYGADEEKAMIAGILHDATKETDEKTQLELIEKAGMKVTELERSQTKFFHQLSGAAFAKCELGIEDEEIISAIRYHTTGHSNMTLMEEIIYLADFISADRNYPDIDEIRKQTERGKEYGLLYATKYTIKSVVDKGKILHPDTVDAYNYFLKTYFYDKR